MNAFESAYQALNAQQKAAVDAIEGPVLVIAGPGTGKTQTIALRIANILRQTQVSPGNILCLTYTDTAVFAMRQRLGRIIGKLAFQVKITTFHAYCNELIQANPEKFEQFAGRSDAISQLQRLELISECIAQLPNPSLLKPFGNPELYVHEISSKIANLKRENVTPNALVQSIAEQRQFFDKANFDELFALSYKKLTPETFSGFVTELGTIDNNGVFSSYFEHLITDEFEKADPSLTKLRANIKKQFSKFASADAQRKGEELAKIYEEFQRQLRERGLYDFEDMITEAVNVLSRDEGLLHQEQEQYQYILVDEYQDTNAVQNKAVDLLGSYFDSPNIFVVGDDDQSIYRFQGASMQNVLDFYNRYSSNVQVITLKQNYRSDQLVLDASRSLIEHNSDRIENFISGVNKHLTAAKNYEGSALSLTRTQNEADEANYVAAKIKQLINSGVKSDEIAVIFRNHKDAEELCNALTVNGLNFNLKRGEDILQNVFIKQLLTIFDYLSKPDDGSLLFKILNFNCFQIDAVDLAKLNVFARENRLSYVDLLLDKLLLSQSGINAERVQRAIDIMADWQKRLHNTPLSAMFIQILSESGLLKEATAHPDSFNNLQIIKRVYREIENLTDLSELATHLSKMKHFGLTISIESKRDEQSTIQLFTAHGAKGLEFEHVFIIKLNDKSWGNVASRDKIPYPLAVSPRHSATDANEEERRLLFVALTRAKSNVYLSYPAKNADGRDILPSVFLEEITDLHPQEHLPTDEQKFEALVKSLSVLPPREYTDDQKAYLKSLLVDYRLSATDLQSYKRCKRVFLLQKLIKVPMLATKNMVYGTCVHSALRDAYAKAKREGAFPDINYLQNRFLFHLEGSKLSTQDTADAADQGANALSAYWQQASPLLSSKIEYNFYKHNTYCESVPITGKIDRVDFIDNSNVVLVDLKTGNPDSKSKELSTKSLGQYYKQLLFYTLLVKNTPTLRWSIQKLQIEFVEQSKKKGFVRKEYDLNEEHLAQVTEEVKSTYQSIMNLDFEMCDGRDCPDIELCRMPLLW